jgi:hypothetical protein
MLANNHANAVGLLAEIKSAQQTERTSVDTS